MQNNNLSYFLNWWDDTGIALMGIALGIIAKFLYEFTIKYLRARNFTFAELPAIIGLDIANINQRDKNFDLNIRSGNFVQKIFTFAIFIRQFICNHRLWGRKSAKFRTLVNG